MLGQLHIEEEKETFDCTALFLCCCSFLSNLPPFSLFTLSLLVISQWHVLSVHKSSSESCPFATSCSDLTDVFGNPVTKQRDALKGWCGLREEIVGGLQDQWAAQDAMRRNTRKRVKVTDCLWNKAWYEGPVLLKRSREEVKRVLVSSATLAHT